MRTADRDVFPQNDFTACGWSAPACALAGTHGGVWNSFGSSTRVTEGRISKASGAVFKSSDCSGDSGRIVAAA